MDTEIILHNYLPIDASSQVNPLVAGVYKVKFLEDGLVGYDEDGVSLIRKEALHKIVNNFKGSPIIIEHQEVTEDNIGDIAIGYASSVFVDGGDGWAEFATNDPIAKDMIGKGCFISCTYKAKQIHEKGVRNNMPYDNEIIDGMAMHLAIVENPRYEDAIILENKTDKTLENKIMGIFTKKKIMEYLDKAIDNKESEVVENTSDKEEGKKEDKKESEKEEGKKEDKDIKDNDMDKLLNSIVGLISDHQSKSKKENADDAPEGEEDDEDDKKPVKAEKDKKKELNNSIEDLTDMKKLDDSMKSNESNLQATPVFIGGVNLGKSIC